MLKNHLKKSLCLVFAVTLFLFSTSCTNSQESTATISSDKYDLYRKLYFDDILYSAIASFTWDDPNILHPDLFVEFFSKKTQLNRLCTDADPVILPENMVEDYVKLFFDGIENETIRKSNFYLPEQHSYEIPIVTGGAAEISIEKMALEQDVLTISYSFHNASNGAVFRKGTAKISLPSDDSGSPVRYLSCEVEDIK